MLSFCRDYNGYFSVIPIKTPLADQSLFWSGTYTLVDVLSMMNTMGVNVVSSTNSLSSLIVTLAANSVSNVYWCSNEGLGMSQLVSLLITVVNVIRCDILVNGVN